MKAQTYKGSFVVLTESASHTHDMIEDNVNWEIFVRFILRIALKDIFKMLE